MKKRGTIYEQNSVTFWPNYTMVTGCMCLFGLMGTGCALVAIIGIFLSDADKIVLPVLALMFSIVFFYSTIRIRSLKEKKVVINAGGIAISQNPASEIFYISWGEVSEIRYEHLLWYGLEYLVITYRKNREADCVDDSPFQYIRLPLRAIEREKIEQIISRFISYN